MSDSYGMETNVTRITVQGVCDRCKLKLLVIRYDLVRDNLRSNYPFKTIDVRGGRLQICRDCLQEGIDTLDRCNEGEEKQNG